MKEVVRQLLHLSRDTGNAIVRQLVFGWLALRRAVVARREESRGGTWTLSLVNGHVKRVSEISTTRIREACCSSANRHLIGSSCCILDSHEVYLCVCLWSAGCSWVSQWATSYHRPSLTISNSYSSRRRAGNPSPGRPEQICVANPYAPGI